MLFLHETQLGIAVSVGNLIQLFSYYQHFVEMGIKLYLLHDIEGEGADLLEGVDGDLVLQAPVAPLLQEVIVDFASADENLR